jgi:hypothetical protein
MLFIPVRIRWETVWAVVSSIEVLSSRSSANWLTAVLLLLQTPLAFVLHVWGKPGAYGDGAAHLQCLTHEELGARAHRHTGRLAHHHHGRRAHGHSTGCFEHGGRWWRSGECRGVVVLDVQFSAVTGASRLRRSLVKSEVACPAFAESLIGCVPVSAQSAHRHPHNFTDDLTSATSNCRRTTNLHSPKPTAIMSDNENGEEMVTKPFKFVTGTPPIRPQCLL